MLTGAGEKSFVAGADINELAVLTPADGKEHARAGSAVFDSIEQLGKPVIAADQRVRARRRLRAGDGVHDAPRVRHRASRPARDQPRDHPGLRGQPAAAAAGRQGPRARDPADRRHDAGAARAYEIGLVNRVVPAAELLTEAKKLAADTGRRRRRIAVRYILEAVHAGLEMPLAQAQYLETTLFGARRVHRGHARRHARVPREARRREWKGR